MDGGRFFIGDIVEVKRISRHRFRVLLTEVETVLIEKQAKVDDKKPADFIVWLLYVGQQILRLSRI